MSAPPTDAPGPSTPEPEQSPQRHLLDTIRAYEVDPPAPARARREHGQQDTAEEPDSAPPT